MHMSDALITPVVGGALLGMSAVTMKYSADKIDKAYIEEKVPYIGVVGAFVFASQMINFAIPGTGSSGHIGGGLLLAILLGPHLGFLTMANVLLIQALFFADGGLLAFGCNLMNLGFFTCYVAYPMLYKPISSRGSMMGVKKKSNMYIGAIVACVVGLQLGALGVVVETILSGQVDLSLGTFLMFMQPIHLAIGLVEGLATGLVITYIYEQDKNLHYDVYHDHVGTAHKSGRKKRATIVLIVLTLLIGGIGSLYASSHPDGLEWSLEKTGAETEGASGIFTQFQNKVAFMPDYSFKENDGQIGTSVSGILGSSVVVILGAGICLVVKKKQSKDPID